MAKLCELLKKSTGLDRDYIQEKLNISKRTFYRYLEELREIGASISYCKRSNSYKLDNDFDVMDFCTKELV